MSTKLIGTGPNQVPTNADLGSMAYQDSNYVNIQGGVASLSSLTVTDYSKFEIAATAKPTIPASLMLDFAKTQSLDNRIEFSRNSIATRVNAKGVIETVAVDVPRFDYDPVTLHCKGLLIEESRANLLTYSEQFDNAAWTKTNCTITVNNIVSPGDTLTGDALIEDNSTTVHYLNSTSNSNVSGTSYSISFYAKAQNRSVLQIVLNSAVFTTTYANFDLATGTVSAQGLNVTPSIVSVGNGWYRCIVTATATATNSNPPFYVVIANSPTMARFSSYTGDGTSGVYIWGAQLEVGGYATSYIPTTTTTVTRQADVAKITGTNFSSFYNQTEGSFYVEATSPVFDAVTNGGSSQTVISVSDNTDSNRLLVYRNSSTLNAVTFYISASGVNYTASSPASSWANSTLIKTAAGYKTNDVSLALSTSTYANSSVTLPTKISQMTIGSNYAASAGFFNGCIGKIAYYPKRLTDNEMLALVRV